MAYFVAGSPLAACLHPGARQTNLFTVNQKGALCWISVDGVGTWSSPFPLTEEHFALPGSFVVASPDFGANTPGSDVLLVDTTGTLQLFTQATPGTSWRRHALSSPNRFVPGPQAFAVLPGTLPQTQIVNQINVLIVDPAGTLHIYSRGPDQLWSLDTIYIGPTAANASLVGLFRVDDSQSVQDVRFFFVDSTGVLNAWENIASFGWSGSIVPSGRLKLTPSTKLAASVRFGTATPATGNLDDANVFAVDSEGRLICYALGANGWIWEPLTDGKFAPPGAPVFASRQYIDGIYQTDVFAVGDDQALHVLFSQSGAQWSAPIKIAPALAAPGSHMAISQQAGAPFQTDLFLCDLSQTLYVYYVIGAGAWQNIALPEAFDPQVALLHGNQQVVFSTGASYLLDLQVDIVVTEDLDPALQIDAFGNPVGGLGIQLNCNGVDTMGFEQFTFTFDPYIFLEPPGATSLTADVECYDSAGNYIDVDTSQFLASLPLAASPRLSAGYRLQIKLSSTPYGGAINEAKFFLLDPTGKQIAKWDAKLLKMQYLGPGGVNLGHVPESALSRVASFQLNIVADQAGQLTSFRSGAGTITYTSSVSLSAAPASASTGERSDCIYSTVPNGSSNSFSQRFQILP